MRFLTTLVLATIAATAVVWVVAWVLGRVMRGARRAVPGAGSFGWVVLFLSSGRMPPPPPASQIEQEMSTRKDRLASQQHEDS